MIDGSITASPIRSFLQFVIAPHQHQPNQQTHHPKSSPHPNTPAAQRRIENQADFANCNHVDGRAGDYTLETAVCYLAQRLKNARV